MSNKPEGGPAFPVDEKNDDGTHFYTNMGMTLRQWYAGMAMQGFAARGYFQPQNRSDIDCFTRQAFDIADAMIAAEAV